MKQNGTGKVQCDNSTMHEAYVNYLVEECNLHGKTLIHYPDAVEKYMPRYIRKHLNPNFDSFYSLDIASLKRVFEILQKSTEWENEFSYKTWNLRLKAVEHLISFKENSSNS